MLKIDIEYKQFVDELSKLINNKENIVFLCIGTKKIVGDSIGPLVGSALKHSFKFNNKIKVVGDYENNIYYQNIQESLDFINKKYTNSAIVVIDSALSSEANIGKIFVENKGLKYGEALKKYGNVVGDISIKAVVGKNLNNKIKNFYVLKKASEIKVNILANIISKGIVNVIESYSL